MDILKILQTSQSDVTADDLLMFEDALATGDYEDTSPEHLPDVIYRDKCTKLISQIRNWKKAERQKELENRDGQNSETSLKEKNTGVIIDGTGLSPFNVPKASCMTAAETVASDLAVMRRADDYRSCFKEYLGTSSNMTESFIDEKFSLFSQVELDCMLSAIPFSEAFLEKRFTQLNHDGIARYQKFSEAFFMKHYADLDAQTVLNKGVNPWRDKSHRSNKLDVFLRLKGIHQ